MDTIQVAFIWSGRIARIHANILQEMELSWNVQIRWCYSKTQKSRERFCEKYGCVAYDSFDALLADGVDCVYICIPPWENWHYEKRLIEQNVSFFVEKPIGLLRNIAQIRENIDLLKEYTGAIKVWYQWKYRKFMDSIMKFVQEQDFCYMIYNRHAMKPFISKDEEEKLFGWPLFSNLSHVVNLITNVFDISDAIVWDVICAKDKDFFSLTIYTKKAFFSINYLGSLINRDYGWLMEILWNKWRLSVRIDDNFQYSLILSSSKWLDEVRKEEISEWEYYREDKEFLEQVQKRRSGYQEYVDAFRTLEILNKIHEKTVNI